MKSSLRAVHICSFSGGLDDMKRKDQRYPDKVLVQLDRHPRFSVFDATANVVIAKTMDWLVSQKMIEIDNSEGYPWSRARITPKGLALIRSHPRARR